MNIPELYKIYRANNIICTDTRKIKRNSLFFALKGERFNGNKFAKEAIESGCSLAIIDEKKYLSKKTILVKNVLETLQQLARYHRTQLSIPIIGITGTNGKTTSKELIATVLKSTFNCYATKGNLNNHIGVPLSILELNEQHQIAIIEMGASERKDIEFLAEIVQPTHGAITNIGAAHLEGFKDINGVIETKNELYKFIRASNGNLFINQDDDLLMKLSKEIKKIHYYGKKSKLKTSELYTNDFTAIKWSNIIIKTKLIGDYQFYNVSLAICIAKHFEVPINSIKSAIESYTPKNNRSEIKETKKNIIIMDAYNANPSSMKAMIDSFSNKKYKNKLCILGDMLELGDSSKEHHSNIVKLCENLGIASFFIGNEFKSITEESFKDINDMKDFIQQNPIAKKTILLKGSRGIGLEKLVDYL